MLLLLILEPAQDLNGGVLLEHTATNDGLGQLAQLPIRHEVTRTNEAPQTAKTGSTPGKV